MIPHISFTEMIVSVAAIYAIGYLHGAWKTYKFFRK